MRSIWLVASALVGCVEAPMLQRQERTDAWQQTPTDQVDILWVVDNSGSMQLEQQLLASGFASFAEELDNTNTDFHLGVITTDFDYMDPTRGTLLGNPPIISNDTPDYVGAFIDRAKVGMGGSGKEKGLEAAEYALSPAMSTGANAGFLRDEANLLVVVISDEEDCSDKGALETQPSEACYTEQDDLVPEEDFILSFRALKARTDKVRVSAIVGPENPSDASCDDTTIPGRRYLSVAQAMGGISSSICLTDWSAMLYELGLNAAGIYTTFELKNAAVIETLVVTIDDIEVPVSDVDGYSYSDHPASITFHGSWIPQRGSAIVATYEVMSGG